MISNEPKAKFFKRRFVRGYSSRKIFIFFLLLHLTSLAQMGSSEHAQVTASLETTHLVPGQSQMLGIHFKLAPHWHVYWKNPGDSGLPVEVELELPEGIGRAQMIWPAPKKITLGPLANYGYEDEVLLFIPIQVDKNFSGSETIIKVHADYLICKDLCLPEATSFTVKFLVSPDPTRPSSASDLFHDYRKQTPLLTDAMPDWEFQLKKKKDALEVHLTTIGEMSLKDLGELSFYPELENLIPTMVEPTTSKKNKTHVFSFPINEKQPWPEGFSMVMVAEHSFIPDQGYKVAQIEMGDELSASTSLWMFVFYAFLGGLILNLMPCVFPVLSIKAMQLLGGDKEAGKREATKQAIYFTLGVLVCFWALAGLLYLLSAQGAAIGWGFHLQSPVFLYLMIGLFLLLTLNLLGVFEFTFNLPGINSRQLSENAFYSGLLAVLVASPCTAPFMGAALGFALTQPWIEQCLIFTGLGLGFAMPMAMLTAFPFWQKFLPRSGNWMVRLKQFFGLLMLGSTLWLLWVYQAQVTPSAFGWLIGVSLVAIVLMITLGFVQKGRLPTLGVFLKLAPILSFSIFLLGLLFLEQASSFDEDDVWEKYSPALVEKYEKQEQAYLVDYTAKWCLTCQVNKQMTFDNAVVQSYLQERKIKLVKADWTSRDPAITDALKKHGRQGVPLVVYYEANRPPFMFPEVLTAGIFLSMMKDHLKE